MFISYKISEPGRAKHPPRRHRLTLPLLPPHIRGTSRSHPAPFSYMARPLVPVRLLQPRTGPHPPRNIPLPYLPQHSPDIMSLDPPLPHNSSHTLSQDLCRWRCRLTRTPFDMRDRQGHTDGGVSVSRSCYKFPQGTLRGV